MFTLLVSLSEEQCCEAHGTETTKLEERKQKVKQERATQVCANVTVLPNSFPTSYQKQTQQQATIKTASDGAAANQRFFW